MGTKENGRQYHHLYRQQQQQQQQQQQERGTNGSVLGGLMRFEARRSDFAGEAFMALKERGHFRTLRFLDLYQCPGLDSQMTIEILKECPLLESFDGNQLLARDILLSSGQRRQRWNRDERDEERGDKEDGGWVCTGMKYLDLHITGFANGMEDVRTHWQVFEQLAKLDKLVYLSIGGKCSANTSISNDNPRNATAENVGDGAVMSSMSSSSTPPPSISSIGPQTTAVATGASGGLDIRLRSGLGQLSTLKRLRMLRFTGVEQQMEVEDVEWMLENLPELKVVQGRLHTDPAKQQVLEKVLERGRVSAWSMYNNVQQAQQK
ncbi:hypothetical protein BC939DRAFT_470530 [Gamsiella multidivaricata]|uniref:uncharacterized protein n=1 Tax=Gamsiella multidivaricata TaxID=101098 RepID=UPI00221FCDE7|nr:uncharacterized protein BC939DRAFT_470530 [Gamsiella multidivaricata]KAI7816068.1 hypothetical protein BC939DRAFT_470530 [Gamsiella multidivaricata]